MNYCQTAREAYRLAVRVALVARGVSTITRVTRTRRSITRSLLLATGIPIDLRPRVLHHFHSLTDPPLRYQHFDLSRFLPILYA
jgi:hypothetical protein